MNAKQPRRQVRVGAIGDFRESERPMVYSESDRIEISGTNSNHSMYCRDVTGSDKTSVSRFQRIRNGLSSYQTGFTWITCSWAIR